MAQAERPILIALISILQILGALFVIALGVALIAGGVTLDEDFDDLASLGGGVVIVIGLITFIIGYGMFKGWRIMWYLGVIFNILDVIFGIISFTFVSAIISAIILYYLFRPKVKTFFKVN